jgi:ABC-type multidrug transport system permease subunit
MLRYYGSGSYVFATVVTDIAALRAIPVAIYAVVLYFMMGLRQGAAGAAAFFTFLGLLELFVMCTSVLCVLVALAAPSPAVGNLVATFTLLLSAMFGGFLVSAASIPLALRWLQWVSAGDLRGTPRGVGVMTRFDFKRRCFQAHFSWGQL